MVRALNCRPDFRAEIATTDAGSAHGKLASSEIPADLTVHMFRRTWSERWKYSRDLGKWLSRHVADYDLIDIHAVWSYSTGAAARAAARRDLPYIIRPAGMLSPYTLQSRSWIKNIYWNLIERRTIDGAAAFHVTSEEEAAEVRALRPDARTFVVPNGVDATAFTVPRDEGELRRRCGPDANGKAIALFLSRLHPKKGIVDRLLPALAAMRRPCYLAIVGAGDPHAPGYESKMSATIKKFQLQDRVTLLGDVNGDARWAFFDGADVFVLPSHAENFGIVVAEAMARSCPVVVTDAVQSCTHVTAAGAGEVVAGDVPTLASTLDNMLADADRRKAYGQAGQAYAQRHFSWEEIAREIRHMYDECLAGREAGFTERMKAG
jgi:glycosyltransferase involved in cell wall biosynthesis